MFGIEGKPHFFLVYRTKGEKERLEKCETVITHYLGCKAELSWVTPSYCLQLKLGEIAKTHVYVFPEFNGPAFEHLRCGKKAILIGPSALSKSLIENETIPNLRPPWIHNSAMQNLSICLSGLSPDDKARYTDLVSFMGGLILPISPATATHLVSNTVQSAKYEVAVNRNIPVMQREWIDEVWRRNQSKFIAATDDQFSKFRLPVFFNLNVCCTMLSDEERMLVTRLVNDNGGTFHRSLKPSIIDILVLRDHGKNSDKFKAAMKHKKTCVSPRWIMDSFEAKYALPFDDYRVTPHICWAATNPKLSESPPGNTTINESLASDHSKILSSTMTINPEQAVSPKTTTGSSDNGKQLDKDEMSCTTVLDSIKLFIEGCDVEKPGSKKELLNVRRRLIALLAEVDDRLASLQGNDGEEEEDDDDESQPDVFMVALTHSVHFVSKRKSANPNSPENKKIKTNLNLP